MTPDVVEMLVYLCENGLAEIVFAEDDKNAPIEAELLASETVASREQLTEKFSQWLQQVPVEKMSPAPSVRIFSADECAVLSGSCRETLLHLERLGIVDHLCRELIIDYLMSLDEAYVGLEELKWAVAMAFMTDQESGDMLWPEPEMSASEAYWIMPNGSDLLQ